MSTKKAAVKTASQATKKETKKVAATTKKVTEVKEPKKELVDVTTLGLDVMKHPSGDFAVVRPAGYAHKKFAEIHAKRGEFAIATHFEISGIGEAIQHKTYIEYRVPADKIKDAVSTIKVQADVFAKSEPVKVAATKKESTKATTTKKVEEKKQAKKSTQDSPKARPVAKKPAKAQTLKTGTKQPKAKK